MRLFPLAALPLLALAVACGGSDADDETLDDAGYIPPPTEAITEGATPAESAAAEAQVRAHADSVAAAVRAREGMPDVGPSPQALPSVDAEAQCLEQAANAPEPTRTRLREICERAARTGEPD